MDRPLSSLLFCLSMIHASFRKRFYDFREVTNRAVTLQRFFFTVSGALTCIFSPAKNLQRLPTEARTICFGWIAGSSSLLSVEREFTWVLAPLRDATALNLSASPIFGKDPGLLVFGDAEKGEKMFSSRLEKRFSFAMELSSFCKARIFVL